MCLKDFAFGETGTSRRSGGPIMTQQFPLLFAPLLVLYARSVSEGRHSFEKAYLLQGDAAYLRAGV